MPETRYLTRKITKQGGSLSVRIPRPFVHTLGLGATDEVRLYLVGQVLCVQRAPRSDFAPGVIAVNVPPRIVFAEEEEESRVKTR